MANPKSKSGPKTETFSFGPWTITSIKGHISKSEAVARYEEDLKLPQLPEMLFGENKLKVQHTAGFGIEFNTIDALWRVDNKNDPVKVAYANAWREARSDCEFISKVVKPFDWTYTTDYTGSVISSPSGQIQVLKTEERIDIEKLKVREKIFFYEDMPLFEDELADNGSAVLSVKMRVMQSSFFILLRFFLRVDGVMVRINDTRLYHEAGKNYILREFSSKEKSVKELGLEPHELQDPVKLSEMLDTVREECEKLEFVATETTTLT
ncbi:TIP41-like protein [Diadema antillarum]|uniref:TIP41-like protein n=1 Tax=Diadema antillarum TaxID=105358 RepID=UPI003A8489E1